MWPQSLAVLFVLALLAALLWLARRRGAATFSWRLPRRAGEERRLQVVERVALTGQHSLHLVACAGRLIVVGVSPAGCNQVASFPEDAARAAGEQPC